MAQKKQKVTNQQEENQSILFALDIGTRSIIGVVSRMVEEKLEIIDFVRHEYNSRVMIDGQIESIDKVSKCILEVKAQLEGRLGFQLNQVAIAAAGRALRTCQLTIQHLFKASEVIGADLLRNMEMEGVAQAQKKIMDEKSGDDQEFYCVGHTVTGYVLDGYEMHEVLGHKGSHCEMTMIAAFLPKIVVESLYATIERSGLQVMSMTLEPIAAMNVVIPPDIRMLNLALVDIGAGTSDIALSRNGTVVAYDMVTVAGDEVTEAIMREYLVDFPTAEQIKKKLQDQSELTFVDILGFDHGVTSQEIMEQLKPVIEQIAETIAKQIIELNGGVPTALFLVGGGSLYPDITEVFSRKLGLDNKRVAVGGKAHLQKVMHQYAGIDTPEYITPIGIALTASQQDNQYFATVQVNGKAIRQFRFEGMKVSDVLILAGQYKYDQLAGTMGKPLRFSLDGQMQTISGELAKPATIRLNGKRASMDTAVKANDDIYIKPARKGKNAQRTIEQVLKNYGRFMVTIDGQPYWAGIWAEKDDTILPEGYSIQDGDVLTSVEITTLEELLDYYGIEYSERYCDVNQEQVPITYHLMTDDEINLLGISLEICLEDEIVETDEQTEEDSEAAAAESVIGTEVFQDVPVQENFKKEEESEVYTEPAFTVQLNGVSLSLPQRQEGPYMLFDILNYVDDEMLQQRHKVTKCLLNGEDQPFTTLLKEGDIIQIY